MTPLRREGEVFVLDLGDGENRFHPDWLGQYNAALDQVENAPGRRALVTAASGKAWSTGLDLDWLAAHPHEHSAYLTTVHQLYARLLRLPVFTVAAVQGHAFGAGAMLTLTHDMTVMRADRGYWCLPEMDLGMAFTTGMTALIQARLTPPAAREAMVTATRYGGLRAAERAIADLAVGQDELLSVAVHHAGAHAAKAGDALGVTKHRMNRAAVQVLLEPVTAPDHDTEEFT